jgi:hypothetical protein
MKCRKIDQNCPVESCLGLQDEKVCDLVEKLSKHRSLPDRILQAAGAVIQEITSGKSITKEQIETRLSICRACEMFDLSTQKCTLCTCYMPFKVHLSTASCPLDPPKWGPIIESERSE